MLTPASGPLGYRGSVSNLSSSPNGSSYPPPPGGEAHWPAQLTVLAAIALQCYCRRA